MNEIEIIVANLKAEIIKEELKIKIYEKGSVPMLSHPQIRDTNTYIELLRQKIAEYGY